MAGEPTLTLVGNITANPEQRGDTVTFTIAHNTRRRDRNGQTVDGDAVFMRCAAFGDLAQNIMRSCYKGMRVVATGYMKTNYHICRAQCFYNCCSGQPAVQEPASRFPSSLVPDMLHLLLLQLLLLFLMYFSFLTSSVPPFIVVFSLWSYLNS